MNAISHNKLHFGQEEEEINGIKPTQTPPDEIKSAFLSWGVCNVGLSPRNGIWKRYDEIDYASFGLINFHIFSIFYLPLGFSLSLRYLSISLGKMEIEIDKRSGENPKGKKEIWESREMS